jgi:hypothetical protein
MTEENGAATEEGVAGLSGAKKIADITVRF